VLVSPWSVSVSEVTLVSGDRVLMRGNLITSEVDEASRDDFEEVYSLVIVPVTVTGHVEAWKAHIGTCSPL